MGGRKGDRWQGPMAVECGSLKATSSITKALEEGGGFCIMCFGRRRGTLNILECGAEARGRVHTLSSAERPFQG